MASKPGYRRLKFGRKLDGKRHVVREIRCMLLGWHEESFASTPAWRWCWYCGEDL